MTDPTPLQLMDRLLDALKEAGIGWCRLCNFRNKDGYPVSVTSSDIAEVCMSSALTWGLYKQVLVGSEVYWLRIALDEVSGDRGITLRNDVDHWTHARFREELAKREGDGA